MKNKILVLISGILIFLGVMSFGKNIYFKNIMEKELSRSLKQNITISKADVNLFNNTFVLENIYFTKNDILIKNIKTEMDLKAFFKNKKRFTINSIVFKDIFFSQNIDIKESTLKKNIITLNKPEITNDKADQFIDEIDKQTKGTKGLTTFLKSTFNNETFSKNTSQNLFQFLLKNIDFIDVVIQKEVNILLKNKVVSFSQKSKEFILYLKNFKNNDTEILIENIIFSGNIDNIIFSGEFKNFNSNLSKNNSIPLKFSLAEIDGEGKGEIYGDFNINSLHAQIFIKLFNFNIKSFKNLNQYISDATLTSEQLLTVNGTHINIDGTTNFKNPIFDKKFINASTKLDSFKKILLSKLINLAESKDYNLSISSNFSTTTEIVSIKTNLPAEIKRGLISERSTFSSFLEDEIKAESKNIINEKTNKIKSFFKNIF
ncbi:MAG: hypothetical protein ACRDAQ_07155 [Cetobacterium sp.]